MKVHWWSCVWGLLCMHAELILSTRTVKVNSSTEIICATPLSELFGVYLHRGFQGNRDVMFLDMENGQVTKTTTAAEFAGRIHVAPNPEIKEGYEFTWQLSLLQTGDTDWYYCKWMHQKSRNFKQVTTKGIIIVVRESYPQEQCKTHNKKFTYIILSVEAFTLTMFLCMGAVTIRCTQFKRRFTPARVGKPSRPNRHHQRQRPPSYFNTSDFRGTL